MPDYQRITVSPIAGALGAEIRGLDIGAGLDEAAIAEIRRALLEHLVIFFRGQQIDDASHKAFTRRFGDIFIHPNFNTGEGDPEIVRVLGTDVSKVWWLVFGIGTAIAGLSGALAAPTRAVNPEMGITILAESFVVTVVGGMGSLPGAVVAGLLVGVVFSITSLFAPAYAELSIFVLMALVLLVRPQGLFGKAGLMG